MHPKLLLELCQLLNLLHHSSSTLIAAASPTFCFLDASSVSTRARAALWASALFSSLAFFAASLSSFESGVLLFSFCKFWPVLSLSAMGDLNSVDVAQATHEGVLKSGGCLAEKHWLKFGRPLPPEKIIEGVYIDDHFVGGIVLRHSVNKR